MAIKTSSTLPHPAIGRNTTGQSSDPSTWNVIWEKVEANLSWLSARAFVVDAVDDLPALPVTPSPDGLPQPPTVAFVLSSGSIYLYEEDQSGTSADGVRTAAGYGGKRWRRLSQPPAIAYDEAVTTVTTSGTDRADLGLSVTVQADGVAPVLVTLALGYDPGTAGGGVLEILEDGVVVATRRLQTAAADAGFMEMSVPRTPAAGARTYTARLSASEAGKTVVSRAETKPEHRRTLIVRTG